MAPLAPPGSATARIWSRGRGPASEAEQSCTSKVSYYQGLLKGCGSFWIFNAQMCILPHSRELYNFRRYGEQSKARKNL